MAPAVLILALILPLLLGAAFLLGRHLQRRQDLGSGLSAVSRQHIDLLQGSELNDAVLQAAKARFQRLLERGEVQAVEASFRAGMHYVFNVRALAEIGTEEAARILERQLQRRLTSDHLEQSWYWIDLANGLRALNRDESLPHLLRCAEAAGDSPLGHFFAAEMVCFLGFATYLRQPQSPLGRAALRTLQRALEGLRFGVQPQVMAEARLGEMVEQLWDHRPEPVHPLVVRVFAEVRRHLRRTPNLRAALGHDVPEAEAYEWQASRLAALAGLLDDYLAEAPAALCGALATATSAARRDILQALIDLRAETAPALLPLLLDGGDCRDLDQAFDALRWSRDPRVGPALRGWAGRLAPAARRAGRGPLFGPRRTHSVSEMQAYQSALRALRGHPSRETELFLSAAAQDWDSACRAAAVSSLGWWEPLAGATMTRVLDACRRDPCADVRQAARAALARLGERQALYGFRAALQSNDSRRVHEAIQVVATEGLSLLWPELDRLADAEDADVAHFAREAMERLYEELETPSQ
jgi:hypothetical protein